MMTNKNKTEFNGNLYPSMSIIVLVLTVVATLLITAFLMILTPLENLGAGWALTSLVLCMLIVIGIIFSLKKK